MIVILPEDRFELSHFGAQGRNTAGVRHPFILDHHPHLAPVISGLFITIQANHICSCLHGGRASAMSGFHAKGKLRFLGLHPYIEESLQNPIHSIYPPRGCRDHKAM